MATVDQTILSTPAGRTGCVKLTTLRISVVWEQTGECCTDLPWEQTGECCVPFLGLIDDAAEDKCQQTLVPSDYSFAKVQRWMYRWFQYSHSKHAISMCQFGLEVTYELDSQQDWVQMLTDIVAGYCHMLPYSDLYLVVRPRGVPVPELIRFGASSSTAPEGIVKPIPQTPIKKIIGGTHSALAAASDDDTSPGSNLIMTPETSSTSASSPGSPIRRCFPAALSWNKRVSLTFSRNKREELELTLLAQDADHVDEACHDAQDDYHVDEAFDNAQDDYHVDEAWDDAQDDYHVEEACDDDYGAVDDGTVDTYVGSFNTGNTPGEWEECLRFFAISRPPNTKTTRVPIKKLPGMSVGLFDYQLMGVFNLLKLSLQGVRGGFLADEQGLGKTQEMFGLVALTHGLRRSKAEVLLARASGKPNKHNRPGSSAKLCFADSRYGFRCYCYHELTQQLADLLLNGPNVIIVPSRNLTQTLREAKSKLDTSALKIRLQRGAVNDRLTDSEAKSLSASITAKEVLEDGSVVPSEEYYYKSKGNSSEFVIITTPDSLDHLLNNRFGTDVKVSNADRRVTTSGLLPGIVLMDEFHEYMQPGSIVGNNMAKWLQDLRMACRGPQQPVPLVYFVSGTPLGESTSDIRPALSLLSHDSWETDTHPMADATLASLDGVTTAYNSLATSQARGTVLDPRDVANYRRQLGAILKRTMVRRLGTDSFRGKPLTNLGPLSVNIVDHSISDHLVNKLQSLADATRAHAEHEAATNGIEVSHLLRSTAGQSILLKLRLASTFPSIASPLPKGETFTFDLPEILSEISTAAGNVTKTRYFTHLPRWAAHSPKLATLDATITTMVADKTPIPGEACHAKKLVVFAPLEAEALLLYAYLLNRKTKSGDKLVKPVWLHSGMPQAERQGVIDGFLGLNNAAPNVLVTPIALAGTGLNFQRAGYSVLTGPAWTKRENQQAYYRIHRVGQKQQTRLKLLTGRWNPADRMVLARHAGREVEDGDLWEVGNGFGGVGEKGGMVERHQAVEELG